MDLDLGGEARGILFRFFLAGTPRISLKMGDAEVSIFGSMPISSWHQARSWRQYDEFPQGDLSRWRLGDVGGSFSYWIDNEISGAGESSRGAIEPIPCES